jgi:general secretion pathway protein D
VLGGLIEDRVRESEQKVPFLGDLPLLGYLFRAKQTNKDKVNLMVFIHPTILRDAGTADRYTSSKYNFVRGQQLDTHGAESLPLMPGEYGPQLPEMRELLELPPPFEATPEGVSTGTTPSGDGDG